MKSLLDVLAKAFFVKDYISVEVDPINNAVFRLTIEKELIPRNIQTDKHTVKVEVKGSIRNPKSVIELRLFDYSNEEIYSVLSYLSSMLLNSIVSATEFADRIKLPEPQEFVLDRDPDTFYVDYDTKNGEVYIIQEKVDGRKKTTKVGETFRNMCLFLDDKSEKILIKI